MTDRYCVFGHPVGHSKSPRIHKAFAEQFGDEIAYEAIEAPRDGFAGAWRDFVNQGGKGANVTVPFKEDAYRLSAQFLGRIAGDGLHGRIDHDDVPCPVHHQDPVGRCLHGRKRQGFPVRQMPRRDRGCILEEPGPLLSIRACHRVSCPA